MRNLITSLGFPLSLRYAVDNPSRPGYVYYLKITLYIRTIHSYKTIYKIGFTSKSIEERIRGLRLPASAKVTVLGYVGYSTSLEAYNIERNLLEYYTIDRLPPVSGKDYKSKLLIPVGFTECYTSDVLGLNLSI